MTSKHAWACVVAAVVTMSDGGAAIAQDAPRVVGRSVAASRRAQITIDLESGGTLRLVGVDER